MKLINKLFIITFIFLIAVLLNVNFSMAFTFNNSYIGDSEISLSDIENNDCPYFVNYWEGNYYLTLSDYSDVECLYNGSNICFTNSSKEYKYDFNNKTWSYTKSYPANHGPGITVVYSTIDIISNSDGTIFFHRAPLEITATLVEETQKAEIMEQMKKMIVGFLKYLIVLVISLLAFWKGWQFLSTQLKKA